MAPVPGPLLSSELRPQLAICLKELWEPGLTLCSPAQEPPGKEAAGGLGCCQCNPSAFSPASCMDYKVLCIIISLNAQTKALSYFLYYVDEEIKA